MYLIYKITNKINNKIYIGLTKTGLELRWKKHLQASFSNRPDNSIFHKAIRKYGIDNFDKEILIDGLSLEEAYEKEKYYIQYFQSYDRTIGYNMTLGGENAIQNIGENNGMSIATNAQRFAAIDLLINSDLSQLEIAQVIGYPGKTERAMRGFISDLNNGKTFKQPDLNYPLRTKKIMANGRRNANALSDNDIQEIINLLETTDYSYTKIETITGHNRHLISNIDHCKIYKELHNHEGRIRNAN